MVDDQPENLLALEAMLATWASTDHRPLGAEALRRAPDARTSR